MIAATPADALRLLDAGHSAGVPGVLVTLTAIEGTSSRAVGTQMAVLADGRHVGSFSGGCIERAIVAEALEVLTEGKPRTVRYGAGSPYIDVRLPCGGGIDLLFSPRPNPALVREALTRLDRREPATLTLGDYVQRYTPAPRLIAFGHGEDLLALVRLARTCGLTVDAFAPDDGQVLDAGIARMATRERLPMVTGDPWSAVVFVFHDRDWEEFLLPQALTLDGFYHGAVGSRRTHAARIAMLQNAGVAQAQIDRLRGSVGLIPATRDPTTLAISIVAEIVQDYHACAGRAAWAPGQSVSA